MKIGKRQREREKRNGKTKKDVKYHKLKEMREMINKERRLFVQQKSIKI